MFIRGPRVDFAYERAVVGFIDAASWRATRDVGGPPQGGFRPPGIGPSEWSSILWTWRCAWDRAFHRHMDILCAGAGLRRMSWQGSREELACAA